MADTTHVARLSAIGVNSLVPNELKMIDSAAAGASQELLLRGFSAIQHAAQEGFFLDADLIFPAFFGFVQRLVGPSDEIDGRIPRRKLSYSAT
jgi:hypothetical protein